MKSFKKLIALFMVLCMVLSLLVGCNSNNQPTQGNAGNNNSNTGSENTGSNDKDSENKEPEKESENEYTGEKVLYLSTGGQLASLNCVEDGAEFYDGRIDLNGSMVTLMAKKDGSGIEFAPNHAAELPTSSDGKKFIVKFREGLKWTDGTPLNAKTYEYTFKMLLDPKLVYYGASNVIDGSAVIVNAKEYYIGNCNWEDVGIKVIDEQTLEINLEYVCSDMDFWLSIGAIPPAHEALFEAGMNADRTSTTYATSIENIPSAGAWRLTEWVLDQKLVFEKNEGYPLSDYFNIEKIILTLTNDSTAAMQMFMKGEIDNFSIPPSSFEQYEEDPRMIIRPGYVFWGLWLNEKSEECPALGNQDFRRALYYVIPRDTICKDVLKVNLPADFYVPKTAFVGDPLSGNAMKYRDTAVAKAVINNDEIAYNEELAKQYFDKAYEALGNQKIVMEVQYFETNDTYRNIMEIFQETCAKVFGKDRIEIVLKAVPPITVYQNLEDKKFQASFAANTISVFNPWDSFKNFNGSVASDARRHNWNNDRFNELQFETTKGSLVKDVDKKIEALAEMEKILIEEVPYVPFYTNDGAIMYSDRIKLVTDDYLPGAEFALFQCDITGEPKPFE